MNLRHLPLALVLAAATPGARAAEPVAAVNPAVVAPVIRAEASSAASSSSTELPEEPGAASVQFMRTSSSPGHMEGRIRMAPFSAVGIALKVGLAGVGFDVATPLGLRLNLRGGGSFFSYNASFNEDGIPIVGTLKFRTVGASLDYFPFNNAFRISPGVTMYNGNQVTATANIPGGTSFTLNDVDYTSSATNPVNGSAGLSFGKKVAPSLTFGFGNMIPRKGGHWSIPFEVGAEYLSKSPEVTLNLQGTACQAGQGCGAINSGTNLANIYAQETKINHDISPLRFFPILSLGVSYSFSLHTK
jgi:hypothetical protein